MDPLIPLELTTNRGHTLRLSYLRGDQRYPRYELRFRNERTDAEWAEEITPLQKHELVEWLGYPVEAPPERVRLEKMQETLTATTQRLDEALTELDRTRSECDQIKSVVRGLLRDLEGAWWLSATAAYHKLEEWVG